MKTKSEVFLITTITIVVFIIVFTGGSLMIKENNIKYERNKNCLLEKECESITQVPTTETNYRRENVG